MSASFQGYDTYVDEVAVERAEYGDRVRLTIAEQGAAVRRMHKAKLSDREIARRLGLSRRTVIRYRQGKVLHATPQPGTVCRKRGCACADARTEGATHGGHDERRNQVG